MESGPSRSVPTLLFYLPARSLGLRTSFEARLLFFAAISYLALASLTRQPTSYVVHLCAISCTVVLFIVLGSWPLLVTRPILLLCVSWTMIGFFNALFAPAIIASTGEVVPYALARSCAFASLALSTILLASLSRPSDAARFARRYRAPDFLVFFLAAPLLIFRSLQSIFSDALTAASSHRREDRQLARLRKLPEDLASCLLFAVLTRADTLQGSIAPALKPRSNRSRQRVVVSFSAADILLALPLLPYFYRAVF